MPFCLNLSGNRNSFCRGPFSAAVLSQATIRKRILRPLSSRKLFPTLNVSLSLRALFLRPRGRQSRECKNPDSEVLHLRPVITCPGNRRGGGREKEMDTKDTGGRRGRAVSGSARLALRRTRLIYIELRWTLVSILTGFSRVYAARLSEFRPRISSNPQPQPD